MHPPSPSSPPPVPGTPLSALKRKFSFVFFHFLLPIDGNLLLLAPEHLALFLCMCARPCVRTRRDQSGGLISPDPPPLNPTNPPTPTLSKTHHSQQRRRRCDRRVEPRRRNGFSSWWWGGGLRSSKTWRATDVTVSPHTRRGETLMKGGGEQMGAREASIQPCCLCIAPPSPFSTLAGSERRRRYYRGL